MKYHMGIVRACYADLFAWSGFSKHWIKDYCFLFHCMELSQQGCWRNVLDWENILFNSAKKEIGKIVIWSTTGLAVCSMTEYYCSSTGVELFCFSVVQSIFALNPVRTIEWICEKTAIKIPVYDATIPPSSGGCISNSICRKFWLSSPCTSVRWIKRKKRTTKLRSGYSLL